MQKLTFPKERSNLKLDTALLLIGFNRVEFIEMRLSEIARNADVPIFLSIDGGISRENRVRFERVVEKFRIDNNSRDLKVNFNEQNLGLAIHITESISRVLMNFEYCIVLEDDVSISDNFVSSLLNFRNHLNEKVLTVGGFSGHPTIFARVLKNKMRTTPYFSAWGWMTSRKGWSEYNLNLSVLNFRDYLIRARSWQKLSVGQQRIWLRRFQKVAIPKPTTWDFQMQFASFCLDAIHLVPTFRICDNIGFQDSRSMNNKNRRPRWMGTENGKRNSLISSFRNGRRLDFLLDSLTFAGDIPLFRVLHELIKRKK